MSDEAPPGAMRIYWLGLGILVAVHLAVVWGLEVLPSQDLPQHAATVRILLDYGSNPLFQKYFALPERFQPYFTMYEVWVWLARPTSLDTAMRLLLSVYVLGIVGAFHALVVAVSGPRSQTPPWPGLLGPALIWSPVACMGFWAFMFAVPLVLLTCALLVRATDGSRSVGAAERAVLFALPVLVATVHSFGAAALVLIFLLFAWRTSGASRHLALALVGVTAVAIIGWMVIGGVPHAQNPPDVTEAIRRAFGLEFINGIFQVRWYNPLVTLNYFLWTILGPYRLPVLCVWALILGGFAWFVRRSAAAAGGLRASPHPLRFVAVALVLIAWFVPWGLRYPHSGTFLDLRIIVLAFALVLATLPARWFDPPRVRAALLAVMLAMTGHFAYRAAAFSRDEAEPALALIERVPPDAILAEVMFENASDEFGQVFAITQNLPVYHLVRSGGITPQFWGLLSPHLPIRWRPGMRPPHVPDWRPWLIEPQQLDGSDYLFVNRPHPTTSQQRSDGWARAVPMIGPRYALVECAGPYCLYRAR